MPASICYLEDGSKFEFTPEGSSASFEPEDVPEEGAMVFDDPDNGRRYLVTLENYEGDLEADTVYELKTIVTEVTVQDEDEEEEEDEEEDETEEEETVPPVIERANGVSK